MSDTTQNSFSSTHDLDQVYDGQEIQLLVFLPFMGPGVDTATGQLLGPPQNTYVMHSTQLRMKPTLQALQRFEQESVLIIDQLEKLEGLVGFAFGLEPRRNVFRTMGVWRSTAAIDSFTGHGAHYQSMNGADAISFSVRGHCWEVPASEMPPRWEAAIAGLAKPNAGAGSPPPQAVTTANLIDLAVAVGQSPKQVFQISAAKLREMFAAAGLAP